MSECVCVWGGGRGVCVRERESGAGMVYLDS